MPFYNGQPHHIHGADLQRIRRQEARSWKLWDQQVPHVNQLVDTGQFAEARAYVARTWSTAGRRHYAQRYPSRARRFYARKWWPANARPGRTRAEARAHTRAWLIGIGLLIAWCVLCAVLRHYYPPTIYDQ